MMSLALAGKIEDFFGTKGNAIATSTFKGLLEAPWMSSGLIENNAFTTTLILRLFGFMVEAGVVTTSDTDSYVKARWETNLGFRDFASLARRLSEKTEPFARFLFDLLPRTLQQELETSVASGQHTARVMQRLSTELGTLIRTTSFYDPERFSDVTLSDAVKEVLAKELNGYLVMQLNRLLLHDVFPAEIQPLADKSLKEIALDMASETDLRRFKINDYPPAAAVLYWFVDGVARARISLKEEHWTNLCSFAANEFGRQRSLVVARHAAMMDPVAMAMSACLCARLRTISNDLDLGTNKDHHAVLPSTVELESAVVDLFAEQTASGIWPKYFPLFHYQDAGSNFCFTFELLEAILVEFGGADNHLLSDENVIKGLERAVISCERNRLDCAEAGEPNPIPYRGWNSGGNLETLRRGQPESWATAVVHMFLFELTTVLSRHVQRRLLRHYAAKIPSLKAKKLDDLLDIELILDGQPTSLTSTLAETIVTTFKSFRGDRSEQLRKTSVSKSPLSALLFGPPGTSKTEVAKAIAAELDWPLLEIDPSHFLQDSFQNIYVQAERIFEDVMDMCGVVVLFDEMDALVQKRDGETLLDTESKFLTTYMLPKLSKLHDRGQLVFLMATNFQATFDDAIKRAGRFDLLLCMGPPTLAAKCAAIHRFLNSKSTAETEAAGSAILKFAATDPWIEDQLGLYTYGEFLSFISKFGDEKSIGTTLQAFDQLEFKKTVEDDSRSVNLRRDDLDLLRSVPAMPKWQKLQDLDGIELSEKMLKSIDARAPVIKYVLDRKQSRRQYVSLAKKLK